MLKQSCDFMRALCRTIFSLVLFTGLAYAQTYTIEPYPADYSGPCSHTVTIKVKTTSTTTPSASFEILTKDGQTSRDGGLDGAGWSSTGGNVWEATITLADFSASENGALWLDFGNSVLSNSLYANFTCQGPQGGSGHVSQDDSDDGNVIIVADPTKGGACPATFTIGATMTLRYPKPARMPQAVWDKTPKVVYYRFVSSNPVLTPVLPQPFPAFFRLPFPPGSPTTKKIETTKWRLGNSSISAFSANLKLETLVPDASSRTGYRPGSSSKTIKLSCRTATRNDNSQQNSRRAGAKK